MVYQLSSLFVIKEESLSATVRLLRNHTFKMTKLWLEPKFTSTKNKTKKNEPKKITRFNQGKEQRLEKTGRLEDVNFYNTLGKNMARSQMSFKNIFRCH